MTDEFSRGIVHREASMIYQLGQQLWFPNPNEAERGDYDGLLAVGGDLGVERLLLAYRSGIFPWSVNPTTWWSPDPRGIIELDSFHISRSLRRVINRKSFDVKIDTAFREVINACATTTRDGEPWISEEFISAYTALHRAGHAHSVECWQGEELVGGVYGVATAGLFAAESMFYRASNASKVALVNLTERLRSHGFALFDIQMVTPTTRQFGATEIPRPEYLKRLEDALTQKCRF